MRRFLHPLPWRLFFLGVAVVPLGWGLFVAGVVAPLAEQPGPWIDPLYHENYLETLPGSRVAFEMLAIPGGMFTMGSPEDEKGRSADEGPQHRVQVRPFWMGKTEVTWDEFDVYYKAMLAPSSEDNDRRLRTDPDAITGPTPPYVDETYGHGREGHPVLCLSQHAAMEYCRWLSKKTGKIYRLPTEAEWEYAARAGSRTAYFFGDDPSRLGEYAWYSKNAAAKPDDEPHTHLVGTRKANPWGLHDMYGNVMEWCLDHYQQDYYATFSREQVARWPVLLPTEKRWSHVARGGSWADDAPRLRSAARRGSDKSWLRDDPNRPQSIWWLTRMDMVGFRVVRPVDEQVVLLGLRSQITRASE